MLTHTGCSCQTTSDQTRCRSGEKIQRIQAIMNSRCFLLLAAAVLAVAPAPAIKPSCEDGLEADIYFLMDRSDSKSSVAFDGELSFANSIARTFSMPPNDAQFAFGGFFNKQFTHVADLHKYTDHQQFGQVVLKTPQHQELTHMFDALNAIKNEGYLTSNKHGARPKVIKVLVVVTDSPSQDNRTLVAAEALRRQNIIILSVSTGQIDQEELRSLAGDAENMFLVHEYGALDSVRELITRLVCEVSN